MESHKNKQEVDISGSMIYLILYNLVQTLGWTLLSVAIVTHMLDSGTVGMYDKGSYLLNIFQSLALLEIVHPMLGLVKTGVALTAVQVASRIFITWGIAYSVPEVQNSIGVPMFMLAWSLTEIIRYSYYMCAQVKSIPYVLQWCRYTLFIVLYPIGVTGELLSVYGALPYLKKSGMYSVSMPNSANFGFSYYSMCIFAMIMYIPVFPQLYIHMFTQRRKILGDKRPKTE